MKTNWREQLSDEDLELLQAINQEWEHNPITKPLPAEKNLLVQLSWLLDEREREARKIIKALGGSTGT